LIGHELPHGVLTVADEPIEGVLLGFAIVMLWSLPLGVGYRQQRQRVVVLARDPGHFGQWHGRWFARKSGLRPPGLHLCTNTQGDIFCEERLSVLSSAISKLPLTERQPFQIGLLPQHN